MTPPKFPDDFELIAAMQKAKARAEKLALHQDEVAGRENGYRRRTGLRKPDGSPAGRAGRAERQAQSLVDQIYQIVFERNLAEIDAQIAHFEVRLRERYGKDFTIGAAKDVLGEEAPERRSDESDADYRARLKRALFAKIFDENGEIKPEYADLDIAQWLLWQREREIKTQAEAFFADDGVISAEEQAVLEDIYRNGTANAVHQAARGLKEGGAEQAAASAKAAVEERHRAITDAPAEGEYAQDAASHADKFKL